MRFKSDLLNNQYAEQNEADDYLKKKQQTRINKQSGRWNETKTLLTSANVC